MTDTQSTDQTGQTGTAEFSSCWFVAFFSLSLPFKWVASNVERPQQYTLESIILQQSYLREGSRSARAHARISSWPERASVRAWSIPSLIQLGYLIIYIDRLFVTGLAVIGPERAMGRPLPAAYSTCSVEHDSRSCYIVLMDMDYYLTSTITLSLMSGQGETTPSRNQYEPVCLGEQQTEFDASYCLAIWSRAIFSFTFCWRRERGAAAYTWAASKATELWKIRIQFGSPMIGREHG